MKGKSGANGGKNDEVSQGAGGLVHLPSFFSVKDSEAR